MIGDNIKILLKERNMSQRDLATAVNKPQKTIQELIAKNRPGRDWQVVKTIASVLNCSTHRLLFGEEDPHGTTTGRLPETMDLVSGIYRITVSRLSENDVSPIQAA